MPALFRKLVSKSEFQHAAFLFGDCRSLTGFEPQLDGLQKIGADLVLTFPLRDAAGKCRDFSPKTTFFCLVNYGFDRHDCNILAVGWRGKRSGEAARGGRREGG